MSLNESPGHPDVAGAQLANKPRTRQRVHKAPPALDVPDINDDATERKRVLNVLAQRRYREKKRHIRKVGSASAPKPTGEASKHDRLPPNETITSGETAQADTPAEDFDIASTVAATGLVDDSNVLSWDMGGLEMSRPSSIMGTNCSDLATEVSGLDVVQQSTGGLDGSSVESPLSLQSQGPIYPRTPFNTLSPSELSADGIDLSFPDSYLLPVSEFALMRAFFRIAARLGCKSNIFDLHSLSPFADPGNSVAHLPQTWQPTAAQILIPHHPILDFLPWPSVRERIIYTLTMPEEMRPTVAKDPTALVDFAHDLDDSAEGIRVWGPDVYDPSSWEIGQQLFERWWFLFDRCIIEQSNTWRTLRGAAKLKIAGVGAGAGPV